MVDPNTRNAKRTPVTLKIKFKSETLEQFIERYAVDVSQGGIFIRTKDPLAVGTQMKFEFQLKDGSALIGGEGTVVWTRENDPSRPAIAPGMGVRFDKLADGSQGVLERILSDKAKALPQRPSHETTKPPMFTDTPTRVAPAPIADAMLDAPRGRKTDSERTPLPSPMPFHSDADDFDERAFEEATKVRSLEELAAQAAVERDLAGVADLFDPKTATAILPPDELAVRRAQARADSTIEPPGSPAAATGEDHAANEAAVGAEPFVPELPATPTQPRATPTSPPRLLDTSPSPRTEQASGLAPVTEPSKTKLGLEPARAETSGRVPVVKEEATGEPQAARDDAAKDARETRDAARKAREDRLARAAPVSNASALPVKRPSSAPIVIGLIAVVAVACTAVWFFVLRDNLQDGTVARTRVVPGQHDQPDPLANEGAARPATPSNPDTIVPGTTGSNAVAVATGSNAALAPDVAGVPTIVTVLNPPPGTTVALDDQSGPPPFEVRLEKGKSYVAHVSAPGFVTTDVPVVGGIAPSPAKLVTKLHLLTVASDPAGAQISVEGASTGKVTPADVDLKAFASKTKVRVSLHKPGYRTFETTVDLSSAIESADKVVAKMPPASLTLAPVAPRPPPRPPAITTNGSGSDNGSTTPTGSGSSSYTGTSDIGSTPKPDTGSTTTAPTPPPAPPSPPTTPPPTTGSASAEPEPQFIHHP